jgi:hypothetical protein
MDIPCPRCGELWHADVLHEIMDEAAWDGKHLTYSQARKLFQKNGCGAVPGEKLCKTADNEKAELARMMFEVLGDDVDGIAAELADFDGFGDK